MAASGAGGKDIKVLSGKVIVRVNLLDNSQKTLLVEPTTTVQDVIRTMADKVGFANPADDCLNFSLHEVKDGVTIERALPGGAEVVPIQESWDDSNAKFVFQIKLFTASLMASTDSKIIYMAYIQSVYNIISGIYPVKLDDVAMLAALQLQNKFGDHNPDSHKPGFLTQSLLEYIPNPWFNIRTPKEWEEKLFVAHSELSTTTPMADYVAFVSGREYYGSTLFGVRQKFDRKMPKTLLLGVNAKGVLLLKPGKPPQKDDVEAATEMVVLASHPLSDIYRWAYKPGVNFYFEMKPEDDSEENPVYTFSTVEGQHIADMLTDYAMALLREMGLNPDGTRRDDRNMGAVESDGDDSEDESEADDVVVAEEEAKEEAEAAPAEAAAPEEAVAEEAPAEEAAAEGASDLPPGWIEVEDPDSGDIYYYNNDTGESAWDKPTA
uniref:WW domain-containing protein n=1 Tax=Bicosoecida sp. CB-2014 TaxID=1486930 RepID=A0A7S1CBC4_9STRA